MGIMMGSLFPILTFLIIFSRNGNIDSWTLFFIISVFAIIPLLFIAPFISKDTIKLDSTDEVKDNYNNDKIIVKPIILMCVFIYQQLNNSLRFY